MNSIGFFFLIRTKQRNRELSSSDSSIRSLKFLKELVAEKAIPYGSSDQPPSSINEISS